MAGWPRPVLGGGLAGLAALTHLNGLIYLAAGAIWLLFRTGWKPSVLFCATGVVTLLLYGGDAAWHNQLPLLVRQFLEDPATQQNFHIDQKIEVLLNYHQIFFHGINEISLSVLAILCLIGFRKHLRIENSVKGCQTMLSS